MGINILLWKITRSELKSHTLASATKTFNSWNQKKSTCWFQDMKLLVSLKQLDKKLEWEKLVILLEWDLSRTVARIASFVGVEGKNCARKLPIHPQFFPTWEVTEHTFKFQLIGLFQFLKTFHYLKLLHCSLLDQQPLMLWAVNSNDWDFCTIGS